VGVSANGKPDTNSYVIEADWVPFGKDDSWGRPLANLRLGIQSTIYMLFNGGTKNPDGVGDNASGNKHVVSLRMVGVLKGETRAIWRLHQITISRSDGVRLRTGPVRDGWMAPQAYSQSRDFGAKAIGMPFPEAMHYDASESDASQTRDVRPAPRTTALYRSPVPGTVSVMEACIPALRRYAGSLLRDRQEVDDLVHDCLVRALDRLHTRRGDSEMRPWLFAIMHNLYVSQVRRKRMRGEAEPLETVAESAVGVGARQEEHVQTREVMAEVQRLPDDLRSVLLLVTVEDLSYSEVAEVLDIPIGTVMSRLSRARERLRRAL
jgi:RNA polymerase sigma-70 factor (ECF subfamily)